MSDSPLALSYPWLSADDTRPVVCCLCNGAHGVENVFSFSINNLPFTITRCVADDLMFLSPQPGPRYADSLYNHPSYYSGVDDMYGLLTTPEKGREVGAIRVQEFEERGGLPKNLLEVGCGLGYTLEVAQSRGVDVCGIEFSQEAVLRCKERGLAVFRASLDDLVPPEIAARAPYDAIAIYSVLEHVPNPVHFLSKIAGLLSPGGRLVVRVPEISAEGPWLSLVDHLWHFSRNSLSQVLAQNGFSVSDMFMSGKFQGLAHKGTLASVTAFATQQ